VPGARRGAAHDGVTLRLELSERSLRPLHLPVQLDAARGPLERASKQEHIVVAVRVVRVTLRAAEIGVGLAHVGVDPGKLIAGGRLGAAGQLQLKLTAARTGRSANGS
jgi:hypothetical protein